MNLGGNLVSVHHKSMNNLKNIPVKIKRKINTGNRKDIYNKYNIKLINFNRDEDIQDFIINYSNYNIKINSSQNFLQGNNNLRLDYLIKYYSLFEFMNNIIYLINNQDEINITFILKILFFTINKTSILKSILNKYNNNNHVCTENCCLPEEKRFQNHEFKLRCNEVNNFINNQVFFGTKLAYIEHMKYIEKIKLYHRNYATKWLKSNLINYTIKLKNILKNKFNKKYTFEEYNMWKNNLNEITFEDLKIQNLKIRKRNRIL